MRHDVLHESSVHSAAELGLDVLASWIGSRRTPPTASGSGHCPWSAVTISTYSPGKRVVEQLDHPADLGVDGLELQAGPLREHPVDVAGVVRAT